MQRSETQFVKNAVNILVLRTPRTLKIRITQPDAEDDAIFPYMISLGDHHISGEVKNNEILEETFKKDVAKGDLQIWFYGIENNPISWPFVIQEEAQLDEIIDVQTRLNALSYCCGPLDGKLGPKTVAGLLHFQTENQLDMCGKMNEETLNQLKMAYGS